MDIKNFIQNFTDQFEDTDASVFTAETKYRELDEWSSLIALSILAMIDEEYDIQLKGEEMRATNTIQELFDLVASKQDYEVFMAEADNIGFKRYKKNKVVTEKPMPNELFRLTADGKIAVDDDGTGAILDAIRSISWE